MATTVSARLYGVTIVHAPLAAIKEFQAVEGAVLGGTLAHIAGLQALEPTSWGAMISNYVRPEGILIFLSFL